jgi:hypothetical protein
MRRTSSAQRSVTRAAIVPAILMLHLTVVSAALAQRSAPAASNAPRAATGWDIAGVPALNFDADEGIGYGAIVELYNYGAGALPYRFSIQPTLFLTTEGRRDATVFFDAPGLLPGGWRLIAFAGREQQLAQPYYGIGNNTTRDISLEEGPNPYFYRFGRTRLRATADLQHRLPGLSARLLVGAGVSRSQVDPTPFDSGTTLLATELGGRAPAADRTNYVRAGIVWDSRDREIAPHSGMWAEAIVLRSTRSLGSTNEFTRWTTTVRQYVPLSSRVTFAQRLLAQDVDGDAPFHELATIQSSFKQQEGLGGSSSVRGLPKDRYIGKGMLLSNSELRWRAADFLLRGRASSLSLSTFLDAGRVWADRFDLSTALTELHAGYGAGARLGFGQSFIVAVDVGHSNQSTAPVYIGLGWMF